MIKDLHYYVGTLAQCEAYIAKMDILMGFPHKGTLTYARPIKHESIPPMYMVLIKPEISWPSKKGGRGTQEEMDANSTGQEIAARKRRSVLQGEGAWPDPETP